MTLPVNAMSAPVLSFASRETKVLRRMLFRAPRVLPEAEHNPENLRIPEGYRCAHRSEAFDPEVEPLFYHHILGSRDTEEVRHLLKSLRAPALDFLYGWRYLDPAVELEYYSSHSRPWGWTFITPR